MPNPYVLLGGLLAVLAIAAASFGFGHHVEYLSFVAYQKAQTAAAEKQIADNQAALLKQQQDDKAALDQINLDHSRTVSEITQRKDALLVANRDLSQRLRVGIASPGSPVSHVPQTGTGGPVDAETSTAALDQRSSEFFISEFAEADQLAADYASLQQVIVHDREVCNGSLPGVK